MNINELRKQMMLAKKENPEKGKVLSAFLSEAQLIAKNDGNREVTEEDIINAVKREVKKAEQAKESGAPYSELTFLLSREFLPREMDEIETEMAVEATINSLKDKANIGNVMKQLTTEYGNLLNKKLASKIVKEKLQKKGN